MTGKKEIGRDEERFGNTMGANPGAGSEKVKEPYFDLQGNPDRLPPHETTQQDPVRDPARDSEKTSSELDHEDRRDGRRHENRQDPRSDHPTGHMGYNRTHNKDVIGPVVEGSDKI